MTQTEASNVTIQDGCRVVHNLDNEVFTVTWITWMSFADTGLAGTLIVGCMPIQWHPDAVLFASVGAAPGKQSQIQRNQTNSLC